MAAIRRYPSDVKDEEWAFVAPHLALMREEAPQREDPLRAVFNALRYLAHTGCPWRYLPHRPAALVGCLPAVDALAGRPRI